MRSVKNQSYELLKLNFPLSSCVKLFCSKVRKRRIYVLKAFNELSTLLKFHFRSNFNECIPEESTNGAGIELLECATRYAFEKLVGKLFYKYY